MPNYQLPKGFKPIERSKYSIPKGFVSIEEGFAPGEDSPNSDSHKPSKLKRLTEFKATDQAIAKHFNIDRVEGLQIGFYEDDYGDKWYFDGERFLLSIDREGEVTEHHKYVRYHFKQSGQLDAVIQQHIEEGLPVPDSLLEGR